MGKNQLVHFSYLHFLHFSCTVAFVREPPPGYSLESIFFSIGSALFIDCQQDKEIKISIDFITRSAQSTSCLSLGQNQ